MIEISGFEKLQRDIAKQAQKMLEGIAKDYSNIFSMLPHYFQAALSKLTPVQFNKYLGNVAAPINLKDFPNNYWEAKAQTNSIKDQLGAVQTSMQVNAKRQQADEATFNQLIKEAKTQEDINDLLGIRNGLNDQYSKTSYYLIALEDKLLGLLDISTRKRRAIAGLQQSTLNYQRQALAAQITQNRIQQAFGMRVPFGVHPATMQNNLSNFVGRYTTMKGLLTELGILVGKLITTAGEVYTILRRGGMDASQSFSEFLQIGSNTLKFWKDGILATPSEFAHAMSALANSMGSINVPDAALRETTNLISRYHVAASAAANLVSQITRLSGWSGSAANNALILARSMARTRQMSEGTFMQDLAANAEIFANYAGKGFTAFARSVASAEQYDVKLADIEGMMDRMSTDFEGTLMGFAKVQAILPSFNADQFLYISQAGTADQMMEALHTEFAKNGIRFENLMRGQQIQIASGLGLSRQAILNFENGKKEPTAIANAGPKTPEVAKAEDTLSNWKNSIGDLIFSNKWLLGGIATQTAALIANTVALTGTGFRGLLNGAFWSKMWKGTVAPGSPLSPSGLPNLNNMPLAAPFAGAGAAAGGVGFWAGLKNKLFGSTSVTPNTPSTPNVPGSATAAATTAATAAGPAEIGLLGKATAGAKFGLGKIPIIGALLSAGIDAYGQHAAGQTLGKSLEHGSILGGSQLGGGAAGAAIGTMIFPGVGTVVGGILGSLLGGFGGEAIANKVVAMPTSPTAPELAMTNNDVNNVTSHMQNFYPADGTKTVPIAVDTSKVEDLLQKLIRAVESGHIIVMDGREVGKGVLKSYAHGN